jgi:hypothetical protein
MKDKNLSEDDHYFLALLTAAPPFPESEFDNPPMSCNGLYLPGHDRLYAMIRKARRTQKVIVCFSGSIYVPEMLNSLKLFANLKYLILERCNFPLELLPEFNMLRGLIIASLVVPHKSITELKHYYLRFLPHYVNHLRILAPLNKTAWCNLLQCTIYSILSLHINESQSTQEFVDLATDKAPNIVRLSIESKAAVNVRCFEELFPSLDHLTLKVPAFYRSRPLKRGIVSKLRRLNLFNCAEFDNLEFLTRFPEIRWLTIRRAPVVRMEHLTPLFAKGRFLKSLDLSGTMVINDSLLVALMECKKALSYLKVIRNPTSPNPGFTDAIVRRYLRSKEGRKLKYFELSGHETTDGAFVAEEMGCLDHLRYLGLRYTRCTNHNFVLTFLHRRDLLRNADPDFPLPKLEVTLSCGTDTGSKTLVSEAAGEPNEIEILFFPQDREGHSETRTKFFQDID